MVLTSLPVGLLCQPVMTPPTVLSSLEQCLGLVNTLQILVNYKVLELNKRYIRGVLLDVDKQLFNCFIRISNTTNSMSHFFISKM